MEEKYKKLITDIVQRVTRYQKTADSDFLYRAFAFSEDAHKDQYRKSGAPYFEHPLNVAQILADMRMDYETIAAGLLHDTVEDTDVTIEQIADEFGRNVANLVNGVTKIGEIRLQGAAISQAENFRKMLLSMVQDIRVILIKFADRLHNMRTLEHLPERKQKRIALETREVYAPLAHRLGIARLKWELEDLAFKAIEPEAYAEIVQKVDDKRIERERYIRRMIRPFKISLERANIHARVTGRPKHLYSIYTKMTLRNLPFEEIYDLLAIRIILKKIEECYHVLGIVHSLYTPIHDRFKDYIATPKSNMYQSLHTTVMGPEGKRVEIQIRTEEMDRTAEEGIAAHWRYKEGVLKEDDLDRQMVWLRQLIAESESENRDPNEFMEQLKINLFQDEVFVFSPRGDLYKLPTGSTPVDFAFAIHTDIGLHCLAAKINGKIVPLNHELHSGDTIEVLTSASQKPNLDWMAFVKTGRARSRIKKWIRDSEYEDSAKLGEEIIARELRKYRAQRLKIDFQEIAQSFGFNQVKQLYASVGRGDTSFESVIKKILPDRSPEAIHKNLLTRFLDRARGNAQGVSVQGVNNLMLNYARCCNPIPGDPIIGFVTMGRGIVIHRSDCPNIERLMEQKDRIVDVKWDVERDAHFIANLSIMADKRPNFLQDITSIIASTGTNIESANMSQNNHIINCWMIIEVRNLNHLNRVIGKVRKVKGILDVNRSNGASDEVKEQFLSLNS